MERMEKAYNPSEHEARIYSLWEDSGAFKPNRDAPKDPFSIIMPPPNANGNIHLGTAMFTIEDIMTRYHRMAGHPTLWLPGVDHAGIETQVVFERELAKEGKSRFDLGPEKFYQEAYDYTLRNKDTIIGQLKSMGFSPDWSRLKFTLDNDIIEIVYDTFKRLNDDGLIYRGNRIVNWCPHCHSGFADIEVKYREQIDPLYFIKYGPFIVATVRPETKFGDTAIAVNPKDDRYKEWIGKEIEIQDVLGPMKLKVIADDFVDPEFGTGALKVTPAHDPNDWEMGLRHKLDVKQVIGTDGRMINAGKFDGMPAVQAREAVVNDLQEMGLIDHIDEKYSHSVAIHDRCGTQIEPLPIEQWWLKVAPLVKPAIEAVKNGDIKIIPKRFESAYINWLENLRDWNIGRQNWFGIKVPVYYNASGDDSKKPYLVSSHEKDAIEYYGEGNYEVETDVFDTWFSSSQWPFATLMSTGDFDSFYPTSVMETGRDILYLWVARMVMFGLYRTGKVPFRYVYLHGLVNDEKGKKMSKSRGNVINPLDLTSKFGTDALRLALTIGITPGNDGSLGENKVEGYRNFVNKLWNVSRYVFQTVGENYSPTPPAPATLADKWMLTRISAETAKITESIENFRFSEAGERIYSLLWNDFADWYIEASKTEANHGILVHCLETILKLLHPIAPFVTEVIWQKMAWQKEKLIISSWPEAENVYKAEARQFETIMALVSQIRSVIAETGASKPKLLFKADPVINSNQEIIKRLARIGDLEETGQGRGLQIPLAGSTSWLDLDDKLIDEYRHKLEAKKREAGEYLKRLESQLSNQGYIRSAPPELVEQTRDRKQETELLLSKLNEQIAAINS